ncbi:glycosyltransferase [Vibrio sp. 1733]|uniref:glycosyltransferase n=1 Tax=Vibrio TaxID=662 RepID=UPI002963F1D2|nr:MULTISPECIES: glycosyltransferase [unclassified Vibrio]MDW1889925.1 glycosyltransferase [Vibrio sp. Vb1574]MDW2185250.1 glycosyltransferase [Vibrio sp. 1733]MDW2235571.1 glycosyltransferase [Vibrio sp. 1565-1]
MKKILHVIPTFQFGGISSIMSHWHEQFEKDNYQFEYLVFNDGPLKEKFSTKSSKIYFIPTLRRNPFKYMKSVVKLIKYGNYDVIHVHNSFKNPFILLVARFYSVKKRICHSHTSGLEDKSLKKVLPLLKATSILNSTHLVACGDLAGKFMFGNRPYKVINNVIDVDKITAEIKEESSIYEQFSLPKGKTLVGHVGRFSKVKNHDFILDLASNCEMENVHYVCVGTGPLYSEIKSKIIDRNLEEKITLVPPTTDIPKLLAVFNVYIMPSYFEGISMSLLEAQAKGLPCIVSDKIATANDVGLSLIEFLPLDDSNKWLDLIYSSRKIKIDLETINEKYDNLGYSKRSLKKTINELYR